MATLSENSHVSATEILFLIATGEPKTPKALCDEIDFKALKQAGAIAEAIDPLTRALTDIVPGLTTDGVRFDPLGEEFRTAQASFLKAHCDGEITLLGRLPVDGDRAFRPYRPNTTTEGVDALVADEGLRGPEALPRDISAGPVRFDPFNSSIYARGDRGQIVIWRHVRARTSEVERAFPQASFASLPSHAAKIEGEIECPDASLVSLASHAAKIEREIKCTNWLVGLMSGNASPKHPKGYYRSEAKKSFGVGTRAFDSSWTQAIKMTGNTAWAKPGRKSKH